MNAPAIQIKPTRQEALASVAWANAVCYLADAKQIGVDPNTKQGVWLYAPSSVAKRFPVSIADALAAVELPSDRAGELFAMPDKRILEATFAADAAEVKSKSQKDNVSLAPGLPSGSLTYRVGQPVFERETENIFINRLPEDPAFGNAAGAQRVEYAVVQTSGEFNRSGRSGNSGGERITVQYNTLGYGNEHYESHIQIDRQQANQLAFARRNNNVGGVIDILRDSREAVARSKRLKADELVGVGRTRDRIVGLLTHPGVLRKEIRNLSSSSITAEEYFREITDARSDLNRRTNNAINIDHLFVGQTAFDNGQDLYFNGVSENVFFRAMRSTNKQVLSGAEPYGDPELNILSSARYAADPLGDGFEYAVLCEGSIDVMHQAQTQDLTYGPVVEVVGGYQIPTFFEHSGLHIKRPEAVIVLRWNPNA